MGYKIAYVIFSERFEVPDILAFATWQADPDIWRLVLKRRLLSLLHSTRYG